jgi:hypothetical protein
MDSSHGPKLERQAPISRMAMSPLLTVKRDLRDQIADENAIVDLRVLRAMGWEGPTVRNLQLAYLRMNA